MKKKMDNKSVVSESFNPETLIYAVIDRAVADYTMLQNAGALRRNNPRPWPTKKDGALVKIGGLKPPENLQMLHFLEQGGGLDTLLGIMKSDISGDAVRDRLFSGNYECTINTEKRKGAGEFDGKIVYVGMVVSVGKHTKSNETKQYKDESEARWAANAIATAAGYQVIPANIIEAEKK